MKDGKYKLYAIMIISITLLIITVGFNLLSVQIPKSMKDKNKEPVYFGATYMTMNNPYFEVINDEIRERIESNGDELITMDPALSLKRQISQIRYLITQNVKVIFLNAVDNEGLHEVLEECKEANVKVIAIDTNIKEDEDISCTIVSDNYDAGVQAAKDMMIRKESARILLLRHSQTVSGDQRIQGFVDTIAKHSQYKVVASAECEGQLEKAMPIVDDFLKQGVSFDVVMALNDPSALGALAALQEHQKENVMVYGVDGSPEIKQLISNGKMQGGTVAQSPLTMGKKAVFAAYKLIHKGNVNKETLTNVELITSENIAKYNLEGWQ